MEIAITNWPCRVNR